MFFCFNYKGGHSKIAAEDQPQPVDTNEPAQQTMDETNDEPTAAQPTETSIETSILPSPPSLSVHPQHPPSPSIANEPQHQRRKQYNRPRRVTARMSGSGWSCRDWDQAGYPQQQQQSRSSSEESDRNSDDGEISIVSYYFMYFRLPISPRKI